MVCRHDVTNATIPERGKRLFREIDLSGTALTRGVRKDVELVQAKKGNRYDFDEDKQMELYETRVDKIASGKRQTFLLHIIRKKDDSMMYVIAAGTDKSRFQQLQNEIRQALDSFRLMDRPLPGQFNP